MFVSFHAKSISRIGIIPADENYPANFKEHLIFSGALQLATCSIGDCVPLLILSEYGAHSMHLKIEYYRQEFSR